jgi:hypothetical protein
MAKEKALLEYRKLTAELLVFNGKQPCFKTYNGVPMGMGRAKESRVRKILKALAELGEEVEGGAQ